MHRQLTPPAPVSPPTELTPASGRLREIIEAGMAANTRRAYRSALARWATWADAHGQAPLPAAEAALASYLSELATAGAKIATLDVALAAIASAHRLGGHPDPTTTTLVRSTMAGLRRIHGTRPAQKAAVLLDDLRRMVLGQPPPTTLAGARNRALLLVGWAGAFRRSELAALAVEDVEIGPQGAALMIRRSKADQDGRGFTKHLPRLREAALCPVAALTAWLALANITKGPLFRGLTRGGHKVRRGRLSPGAIALIIKQAAADVGLDARRIGGHSLRAGFATQAALSGLGPLDIQQVTGHRSVEMVAQYVRRSGSAARGVAKKAMGEKE